MNTRRLFKSLVIAGAFVLAMAPAATWAGGRYWNNGCGYYGRGWGGWGGGYYGGWGRGWYGGYGGYGWGWPFGFGIGLNFRLPPARPVRVVTIAASDNYVANVQFALAQRGYRPGPVDGVFGPQTSQALASYQSAAGLRVTGEINGDVLYRLGLL